MPAKKDPSNAPGTVDFETVVSAFGNNAGIIVAPELIEALGAGQRPAVSVDLNGYTYRNTIGVMGGKHLISVSAAVRKETGLKPGDPVRVKLAVETAPRPFEVPDDFAEALANSGMRAFFDGLANSIQRFHVDNINGTKNPDTRRSRIDKAVALFAAGKKR